MEIRLGDRERILAQKIKRYLCRDCKNDVNALRTQNDPNIRLRDCLCMGQLHETWLCGAHRADALRQLEERADVERSKLETFSFEEFDMVLDMCPRCRFAAADNGSGAWICAVCRTIAADP